MAGAPPHPVHRDTTHGSGHTGGGGTGAPTWPLPAPTLTCYAKADHRLNRCLLPCVLMVLT